MKKIALLFTMLCVGALNGMEQSELDPTVWRQEQLPDDVKSLIIMAFAQSGDNLAAVINNIKKASLINKTLNQMVNETYGNLAGFTALVGILAEKFPEITRADIAKKFNTPIAKKYVGLGFELLLKVAYYPIEEITQDIKQGVDVDFYADHGVFGDRNTPLILAIKGIKVDVVKLLLDSGANPYFKYPITGTALNLVQTLIKLVSDEQPDQELLQKLNAIKTLVEDAMKKQQK